jgi:hypothetical protein
LLCTKFVFIFIFWQGVKCHALHLLFVGQYVELISCLAPLSWILTFEQLFFLMTFGSTKSTIH